MKSMLEREREFTPVTASIVDRHVLARGSQEKVVDNIIRKDKEEEPDLIVLTPTCTSSILQEDLQNFVNRASTNSKSDVLLADVNHYRINELQASDRTLEQIIIFYIEKAKKYNLLEICKTKKPSVNILGPSCLGFHNTHDLTELKKLLKELNIEINIIAPDQCSVKELKNLPKAWINLVPYRELGLMAAKYLQHEFNIPYIDIAPIGTIEIARFIRKIEELLKSQGYSCSYENYITLQTKFSSQSSWFSRSIDCQNLTGKKAIVFGDATHSAAITKILSREMGIHVAWAGTYCKYDEIWFKNEIQGLCDNVIITEDYNIVADLIAKTEPGAIFGTQMERHIGKRLNIPCGVISSPVHIQNFSLSYKPFLGYEGTNQIADLIYNSFTLGMEDHLLELFGGHDTKNSKTLTSTIDITSKHKTIIWTSQAEEELKKIPGFVRGKIRRNTEKFAHSKNVTEITIELMYEAKEAIIPF
jgi:light-independent protochlorophyllide reductase subunit B